jgi:hypothetical protein
VAQAVDLRRLRRQDGQEQLATVAEVVAERRHVAVTRLQGDATGRHVVDAALVEQPQGRVEEPAAPGPEIGNAARSREARILAVDSPSRSSWASIGEDGTACHS